MLTLKEFLLDLNKDDYFRVYNPNRDCLEFESFYIPHDPWAKTDSFIFQKPSWRTSYEDLDKETQKLLDDFGDYVVFSIECSSTYCTDFYKNDKGDMEWKQSDAYPHEHAPVLNIFIRPKKESEETSDLNLNWTKDSHISIEDYYNDKLSYDELTYMFNKGVK